MRNPKSKTERRTRAHQRLRQRVVGTPRRPRLSVFKSEKYVYAQVIDDSTGRTLAQANSQESGLRGKLGKASPATKAAARAVGETVAERAIEKGVTKVVFDRGGYIYHGRVKAIADAAREAGLKF